MHVFIEPVCAEGHLCIEGCQKVKKKKGKKNPEKRKWGHNNKYHKLNLSVYSSLCKIILYYFPHSLVFTIFRHSDSYLNMFGAQHMHMYIKSIIINTCNIILKFKLTPMTSVCICFSFFLHSILFFVFHSASFHSMSHHFIKCVCVAGVEGGATKTK